MTKQNKQMRVSPDGNGGRRGHKPGAKRDSFHVENKAESLKRGIEIARNQGLELIWQKQNGQIQGKNSYGNDPANIKG